MYPPIFIIGTGRCGSTLLSHILNRHPSILSISEFFSFITDLGTLIPSAFTARNLRGDEFWRLISTAYPKQNMMVDHQVAMQEVLYPFNDPSARFSCGKGIPAIMQTTIPHLTADFDSFYDEIAQFVQNMAHQTIGQHYQQLFDWMRIRFKKQLWIERSGGSLRIVKRLHNSFPDAKFIHLMRDGRDCAVSMKNHLGFRMVLIIFQLIEFLGVDPYLSTDREWLSDLPEELMPFLPETFSADAFLNYDVSPSLFGHYWSGEIVAGLNDLATIPAQQRYSFWYEDLLSSPNTTLTNMMNFIDSNLVDQEWIEASAQLIKQPTSSWRCLPQHEITLLEKACAPGFSALSE